jgi:hypothetical protein
LSYLPHLLLPVSLVGAWAALFRLSHRIGIVLLLPPVAPTRILFAKLPVNLESELLDHPESILEPEPRMHAAAAGESADKL